MTSEQQRAEMTKRHIDTGFYRVSEKEAKELCGGKLPRHGYFMDNMPLPEWFETSQTLRVEGTTTKVNMQYDKCEVHRTPVGGKMVWAITPKRGSMVGIHSR